MAEFSVYAIPGSPFGRAVLAALEEKQTGYRMVGLVPGEHRAPAHLARNPFGKMPVLEHGDFSLYETQAILRYLDRVLLEPALTPADFRAAARMDQVMNINDWYLFQEVCNVIGFQRVVGPRLMGLVADEEKIAGAMPQARVVFGELARLLGDGAYFAGDAVSLADLMVAPQVEFLRGTPEWEIVVAPHGNLVRWTERMAERDSMRATSWERVAAMAGAAN